MSVQDAPLYVLAHELARDLHERCGRWSELDRQRLGYALSETSRELLVAVALGLSFPATRPEHLQAADETLARLRVLLPLAHELGLLSAGARRHLARQALEAGRMLGGWRKRERRRQAGLARKRGLVRQDPEENDSPVGPQPTVVRGA